MSWNSTLKIDELNYKLAQIFLIASGANVKTALQFDDLIQALDPSKKTKSCNKTAVASILDNVDGIFEMFQNYIMADLTRIGSTISMFLDYLPYKNEDSHKICLTMTIHFLDENFTPYWFTLFARDYEIPISSEDYFAYLEEFFAKFHMLLDYSIHFVLRNDSSLNKIISENTQVNMTSHCIIDRLDDIFSVSLEHVDEISKILRDSLRLDTLHSVTGQELFELIQKMPVDKRFLGGFEEVLECFLNVIDTLTDERTSTMDKVLFEIENLKGSLENLKGNCNSTHSIRKFIRHLLYQMNAKFEFGKFDTEAIPIMASFFNPTYRKFYIKAYDFSKDNIFEWLNIMFNDVISAGDTSNLDVNSNSPCFDDWTVVESADTTTNHTKPMTLREQFEYYLEIIPNTDQEPLKFWKMNIDTLPHLSSLARELLSLRPTTMKFKEIKRLDKHYLNGRLWKTRLIGLNYDRIKYRLINDFKNVENATIESDKLSFKHQNENDINLQKFVFRAGYLENFELI